MQISFDGIGEVCATFRTQEDSGVKPGDVVCLDDEGRVGLGGAGERFAGVACAVAGDGFAGVQIDGLVQVACSGAALRPGWNSLTADGKGGVAPGADGPQYLVVDAGDGRAVIKL